MKFYVLDDFISNVKKMTKLIETRKLGEVIGSQTDSEKAVKEILSLNPDIVLIDLLMPKKDGISVISVNLVKKTLGAIGMLGESGTKDILNIFEMLESSKTFYDKGTQDAYAASICEDPKVVKQRIRRAIKRGLTNTAAMGIEDYYGEYFERFSHTLFNFDAIRAEMDLLREKSTYGGKPSVNKFFEGLQALCELSQNEK